MSFMIRNLLLILIWGVRGVLLLSYLQATCRTGCRFVSNREMVTARWDLGRVLGVVQDAGEG